MLETDKRLKRKSGGSFFKATIYYSYNSNKMIINIVRKTKSISFTITVPAGSHLSIKDRVHKSLQKIYKHSLSYQPPQKFYHFNFLRQLNGFCEHDEFNHCKHLFLYFLLLQLHLAVNRLYAQKQ